MWLPIPVYKRIPQIWFLIGMLFVANGLYVGLHIPASYGYIAVGFVSCIYGIGIGVVRFKHRHDQPDSSSPSSMPE